MEPKKPIYFENKETAVMVQSQTYSQGSVPMSYSLPCELSREARERLFVDEISTYNKARLAEYNDMLAKRREESALEQKKEIIKVQNKELEEREIRRERRREERSQATEMICLDELGYLTHRLVLPSGEIYDSPPIISCPHLKLAILENEETGREVYLLDWLGCEKPAVLKNCSVSEFIRVLSRNQISIPAGRDKKRELAGLILQYLLCHADVVSVPTITFGWYRGIEDEWEFYDGNNMYYKYFDGGDCDGE